jgi:hypothetical protein
MCVLTERKERKKLYVVSRATRTAITRGASEAAMGAHALKAVVRAGAVEAIRSAKRERTAAGQPVGGGVASGWPCLLPSTADTLDVDE